MAFPVVNTRTPLYQRSRHRLINARFFSLPLSKRYSNAGFSGAPLRQRLCFHFFPILCAMTSVVEIRAVGQELEAC